MTRAELTEAVARAICASCGMEPDFLIHTAEMDEGGAVQHREWEDWIEEAAAALAVVAEALREPSSAMHEAGFTKSIGGQMGEWMPEGFPAINAAIYRAMLAASPLAEDQP